MVPATAPERFVLCGYSMGGRIALHIAAAAPERISRLVLVSATAGIADPAERLAADEKLAGELDDTEAFIARWRDTPLFASDPDWVKEAAAEDTRRLRPQEIATMLREYGAGRLPSLWDRLATLAVPTVALAGERDARYCEIAARLAAAMPNARCEIVAGAGHRVAIEAPKAVADAITAA